MIEPGLNPQIRPDFQSREQINPTLLMSWWATAFSLLIIIVRLLGRYVRIERFFPEDKVMMISVFPLTIRMVLVHYVLVLGTNNVKANGLTAEQISQRETGSKLVLAARIFYALFLWTAKLTVCEFLKRVNGMVWRRSVAVFLRFIHVFLVSTLVAVVIATLAECQPFDHYWQVRPDPGPACRSGYANLITMGACDIITDLLLVAFPVPIILTAHMPWKRKLRLVVLFCLSLILVAITCFRVPSVIAHDGAQPYRSLLASLDILAATAVSNMVVIGSFVRDRGVKKLKYKPAEGSASVTESLDHSYVRRNTVMHRVWGSDSDLAADLGIRLDPKLYSSAPAGTEVDIPTLPAPLEIARTGSIDRTWSFHQTHARSSEEDPDHISASDSLELKISPREYIETNQSAREKKPSTSASSSSCRRVSFFDVGGLLSQDQPQPQPPPNTRPRPHTFFSSPTVNTLEGQRIRRGSRAFLEDIGVLSPRPSPRRSRAVAPPHQQPPPLQSHFSSPPASSQRLFPTPLPTSPASADVAPDTDVELQDVGRLLPPQQRQRRTSRERPSDAI